jgi:Peptidase M66
MKKLSILVSIVFAISTAAWGLDDPLFADNFDQSIGFHLVRLPDRDDAVACSGAANASAQIARVYVAQTHLLEPSHPFFVLSANRPALLKVDVTGSGASPQVRVVASNNGNAVGSLCLAGPAALPASVDPDAPSRSNSFTVTLPAQWMRQGLALTVTAGGATRTLPAATLKLGAEPVLSLVLPDLMLFGDTVPTPRPAGWEQQYLSTLAISALQVTALTPVVIDRLPIEPRAGRDVHGVTAPQPAQIATTAPSCTPAQATAGTCTRYSGFGVLQGALKASGALLRANGISSWAQTYGLLSQNQHVGAGLAAGGQGAGDDLQYLFNHEMGHNADMPHWGDAWYGRVGPGNNRHPYAGQYGTLPNNPTGGGFGNTWAYDYDSNAFISPICAAMGKERQEPMERNPVNGDRCLPAGRFYDWFSDYSALFMFRFFAGASASYAGTVPYPRDPLGNAAATPFEYQSKPGMVTATLPNSAAPYLKHWDDIAGSYVVQAPPALDTNEMRHFYPYAYNRKVVTIWGSYSNTTPAATMIAAPLHYIGNLKKTWDPADPTDFADIKSWVSGNGFWWGADLVVRVNYNDSTYRQAVLKNPFDGLTPRSTDPLSGYSYENWSVNFPDDKTIASIVLYHRPMEVRYPGTVSDYNINATGSTVTAANYLSTATVVANRP